MKSPTWPGAGIHTVASLRRSRHRLDRRQQAVARVLAAMRAGAGLRLEYGRERSWWVLTNGPLVATDVALAVINHPFVISNDDGLFRDLPGQTWRLIEPREDHQ